MIIVDKPLLASVKLIFVVPSRSIPLSVTFLYKTLLSSYPESSLSNVTFSSSVSAL